MTRVVHTVGHSTRSTEELLAMLAARDIDLLVDVRRYPGSRRHPQFGRDALAASLGGAGIRYRHEPELGGRRTGRPDSPHTAWRNRGFRAYADHMGTPAFAEALHRLLRDADSWRPAIMCAEAVPWRCHRRLLSDALLVAGADVVHVLGPDDVRPHTLNELAVVDGAGRISYPGHGGQQDLFTTGDG